MESLLSFICEHAHEAQWIIFGLLLLTGFNIPISEDLIIIGAGVIVSTCIPDHLVSMWIWVYAGACLSAWEAYWIGRTLGPKLYEISWFKRIVTTKRVAKLRHYYEKFGLLTFIVVRFMPGGFRNGFSMSAGLSKMPFLQFAIRDEIAALLSVNVLFWLGHAFGSNWELLVHYIKRYDEWAFGVVVVISLTILAVFLIRRYLKRNE